MAGLNISRKRQTYTLGGLTFTSKTAIQKHVQSIFAQYKVGQQLNQQDEAFVRDLLEWHPSASQKIGCGVAGFRIHTPAPYPTKGFLIIRVDGSTTDFSYKQCLNPKLADHDVKLRAACREAIAYQVSDFKAKAFAGGSVILCPATGELIGWSDAHVDHYPVPFIDLVGQWLQQRRIKAEDIALSGGTDNQIGARILDPRLVQDWQEWHLENALLRVIKASENIRLGAHGRTA